VRAIERSHAEGLVIAGGVLIDAGMSKSFFRSLRASVVLAAACAALAACASSTGSAAGSPLASVAPSGAAAPSGGGPARVSAPLEFRLVAVASDDASPVFPTADGSSVRLEREVVLDGSGIAEAKVQGAEVALTMTDAASRAFADFTGAHVGRAVAIVVDGVVDSAPVVKSKIEGGHATLSMKSPEAAERIARELAAHAPSGK
jgi:hypothetical protein